MNPQISNNELGELWSLIAPIVKKNKFKSGIILIISLFYLSLPSFNLPLIEYNRFYATSFMEERALQNSLFFIPKHSWISIDNISPNLIKAVISMEDGKFFIHKGIDWEEIEKSLAINKRRKKIARGGSAITMQLAKNLYLRPDKNIFRKGKELLIACRIEKEVSKKSILEYYLNAIEWGKGIFGIKKAANIYFNKAAKDLKTEEAARLAATIPSPLRYKPTDNKAYVLRRKSIILQRMNDVIIPFELK